RNFTEGRMEERSSCFAAMMLVCGVIAGCQSTGTGPRPLSDYRAYLEEANNMRLVGFSDLQNRSAYAPELHEQRGRWIAYIGHHGGKPKMNPLTGVMEFNGTSIVDVTDPAKPRCLAHIPGQEAAPGAAGAE